MKDQPGPSDMLEELADKAISHMDRLAVTSFESALDEMVDFHRFLIESHTATDENGNTFSLAKMGYWDSLHFDWIRQYSRLFERATEHIGRENYFIEKLAYVPIRLLPNSGFTSATEVSVNILDLANFLVHRLEHWVSLNRVAVHENGEDGQQIFELPNTEIKAYEEVVRRFVGAWENVPYLITQMYQWEKKGVESNEQWQRYVSSWPMMERHLRNTANLLVVAVWNEDDIGSRHYCEMLLRWFDGIRLRIDSDYLDARGDEIRSELTPELFEYDWPAAHDLLISSVKRPLWDDPSPGSAFGAVLQNTMEDLIFIIAGIMIAWHVEKPRNSNVANRTAARLISDGLHDSGAVYASRRSGFVPQLLRLVRLHIIGERFRDEGYGSALDKFIEFFDRLAERPVVPGRTYQPSTRHEREDLMMPWLACLIAGCPTQGYEGALNSVLGVTAHEEAFSEGDLTLRRLVRKFRQYRDLISGENLDYFRRGAIALNPDVQFEECVALLVSLLGSVADGIEQQRLERLRTRPVAESELDRFRRPIEQAISTGNGGIDVFQDFEIVRTRVPLNQYHFRLNGIEKGILTKPKMADESSNLEEVIVRYVQDYSSRVIWADFAKLPRKIAEVIDPSSYLELIGDVAAGYIERGEQPVLLVRGWNSPPWMRTWLPHFGNPPDGLDVQKKTDITSGLYMGTLNSIDVFRGSLQMGESLLFKSTLLRKVYYGANEDGNLVDISYVTGEGEISGSLEFHFSQAASWDDDEVFVVRYPEIIE